MNFWKTDSTNIYLKAFTNRSKWVKKSNEKKNLFIIETNLKFETLIIGIALYYIENKIKLDNIIYQIEFEDKKNWNLDQKIWLKNIF